MLAMFDNLIRSENKSNDVVHVQKLYQQVIVLVGKHSELFGQLKIGLSCIK